MRYSVFLWIALAVLCLGSRCCAQNSKTLTLRPQNGPLAGTTVYHNSYALIVGVARYLHLPKEKWLDYAAQDASEVRDVLVRNYGFLPENVTLLVNEQATRANIEATLAALADSRSVQHEDRVLIFFSGHGQTVKLANGGDMGFLIPYDADIDLLHTENTGPYLATCLPMDHLWSYLQAGPAKHSLLLIDACFGGLLARSRALNGEKPSAAVLSNLLTRPALQVLTAGSKDEEAVEDPNLGHGRFTYKLLEELRAQAAAPGNVFLASELAAALKVSVGNLSKGKQTPQFGSHDTEGEFLFITTSPQALKTEEAELVGTGDGIKIAWGQVIETCRQDDTVGYEQAMAQATRQLQEEARLKGMPASGVSEKQAHIWLRQHPTAALRETLKTLLEFEAINREVEKEGIVVTTAQIDARIDLFLKLLRTRGRIPPEITNTQFMQQNGLTQERVRYGFTMQAKLFALMKQELIEKRLGHKMTPNDFFKARHIFIKASALTPGQSAEEVKKADVAAQEKITQIAADIAARKKTFEEEAKENNDDTSKEQGGNLGILIRTIMPGEFEAAVYALRPGEVSKPIRTSYGYHLIQATLRGSEIPEDERNQYLDSFLSAKMQAFLQDLLTKYRAVNKLAQTTPLLPPGQ